MAPEDGVKLPRGIRRRSTAIAIAAVGLIPVLLWIDRGSLEHGNRLYRSGQENRAAELYRMRTVSSFNAAEALYNLGTVLLRPSENSEAEDYLRLATETGDPAAIQRGHYNLGIHFLLRLEASSEPDLWAPLLGAAIRSNREALRLDPRDEDARWNLAFSQLVLDELTGGGSLAESSDPVGEESPAGADDGLVIPEPGQDDGRPPPLEGNREALARDDPGPLTEDAALGLLEFVRDDPEQLLWGIFWAHRPDVAWWEEGYPGGNW